MKKPIRVAVLAVALGVLALPVVAKKDDPVVAVVNGTQIYQSEVLRELQSMGPQAAQLPPQILYPKLLDKLIVTKLVSKKAYAAKTDKDKEVQERLKDAEETIVSDIFLRNTIKPKITDKMIKARYDELAGKFKPEDEVRARHILVKTEDEAKDLLKKIKGGEDFAKLAIEHSTDSGSAKQGGDLGYFTKNAMVKPFAEAAFNLKAGDITEKPVKTDFGYHVIKIEDRRKSSPPPLSEVKEQISNQVGQELVNNYIEDLQKNAKIEKFNFDGSKVEVKKEEKKVETKK
jgi:peptidyl-prolyl cis-trans isomerase C